jgi:hypothetical protein
MARVTARSVARAFGLSAVLGGTLASSRAVCEIPGRAVRAPAAAIAVERTTTVHDVDTRMARWLVMCSDRVDDADLRLTQDQLGHLPGVRRPSVSLAGTALPAAGLVRYTVSLLDPDGLRAVACLLRPYPEVAAGAPGVLDRERTQRRDEPHCDECPRLCIV